MTRNVHDSFAKDWMREFLSDFGTVETEYEISSEIRHADVFFQPNPAAFPAPMGLFGQMIAQPCLIEPFRNPIPEDEISNCKAKSTLLGLNLIRQAKKEKRKFHFRDRPFLWMLTPTLSPRMQQYNGVYETTEWGPGIYFLPSQDKAAIVAIHALPVNETTLWLRLLGRGTVQRRAINELLALPKDYAYRMTTLQHIAVLQRNLQARQNLTRDLQDVIMTLSITYQQIEAELLEQGRTEGREIREQEIALKMLQGGMSPEVVAQFTGIPIAQLAKLQSAE